MLTSPSVELKHSPVKKASFAVLALWALLMLWIVISAVLDGRWIFAFPGLALLPLPIWISFQLQEEFLLDRDGVWVRQWRQKHRIAWEEMESLVLVVGRGDNFGSFLYASGGRRYDFGNTMFDGYPQFALKLIEELESRRIPVKLGDRNQLMSRLYSALSLTSLDSYKARLKYLQDRR